MNTIKNKSTNLCSVLNERYDLGFLIRMNIMGLFGHLVVLSHEYGTTMLGDNTGN